jgi:hypothetical protein
MEVRSAKTPRVQIPAKRVEVAAKHVVLAAVSFMVILLSVNIPRQSRGLYGVSRSKRLERGR